MSAIRRLNSLSRTLIALCAAVGAVVMAVFVPVTAAAQVEYPPGAFSLTLSATTVPPGGAVSVTANGCEVGVSVTLSVDGTTISAIGDCNASEAAGFRRPAAAPEPGTATATINAPTTPGTYTVRAVENGGAGRTATATLTVAPAGTGTTTVPGGTLPSTGSDTMRVVLSATAVCLIGIGAVIVSRRRRMPSAA